MNVLVFGSYICPLMVKDDIMLAINMERSGEQRFQFEAATKFDSAL